MFSKYKDNKKRVTTGKEERKIRHVLIVIVRNMYDDGICGHYDIDGYDDGNLTGEC
jgi:hypothetical protein